MKLATACRRLGVSTGRGEAPGVYSGASAVRDTGGTGGDWYGAASDHHHGVTVVTGRPLCVKVA